MVSCASTQNEIYGYKLEMSYCNQSALLISTGCDAMVSLMEECILCLSRCTCGFSYSPFYLFVSMSDSCTFYPHSRCCRKKLLLMNHSFNSFKELVEVLKEWHKSKISDLSHYQNFYEFPKFRIKLLILILLHFNIVRIIY